MHGANPFSLRTELWLCKKNSEASSVMDKDLGLVLSVKLKTFKANLYSSQKHFLFDNCGF